MTADDVLDLWEAGFPLTPAARAVLLLSASGHPDAADWPVGRRNHELLRPLAPWSSIDAFTTCPGCDAPLDVAIDPGRLTTSGPEVGEVTIDCDGWHVVARLPTAGDLAQLSPGLTEDELRAQLLDDCVAEVMQGSDPVSVDAMPAVIADLVETRLEDADPDAELLLSMTCVECGHRWNEPLDPVVFAWDAIEQQARRLATEVHVLARHYGWSEQQILALTPFRRHLYLSAVQP